MLKARLSNLLVVAATAIGIGCTASFAAVAPQYDRLLQFQAVLSDQLVEALGERPIDRIKWRNNGEFEVWAGECFVSVTLKADPPKDGMVGRTSYEIAEVSRIACK